MDEFIDFKTQALDLLPWNKIKKTCLKKYQRIVQVEGKNYLLLNKILKNIKPWKLAMENTWNEKSKQGIMER